MNAKPDYLRLFKLLVIGSAIVWAAITLCVACSPACDSCVLAIQNTGSETCTVTVGDSPEFIMQPGAVEFAQIGGDESVEVIATGATQWIKTYRCGIDCGVVRVLIP